MWCVTDEQRFQWFSAAVAFDLIWFDFSFLCLWTLYHRLLSYFQVVTRWQYLLINHTGWKHGMWMNKFSSVTILQQCEYVLKKKIYLVKSCCCVLLSMNENNCVLVVSLIVQHTNRRKTPLNSWILSQVHQQDEPMVWWVIKTCSLNCWPPAKPSVSLISFPFD